MTLVKKVTNKSLTVFEVLKMDKNKSSFGLYLTKTCIEISELSALYLKRQDNFLNLCSIAKYVSQLIFAMCS